MTRKEMISKLIEETYKNKARNENYATWNEVVDVWTMCMDWNHNHPEEEIEMGETDDGFYIEDEVFYYSDGFEF